MSTPSSDIHHPSYFICLRSTTSKNGVSDTGNQIGDFNKSDQVDRDSVSNSSNSVMSQSSVKRDENPSENDSCKSLESLLRSLNAKSPDRSMKVKWPSYRTGYTDCSGQKQERVSKKSLDTSRRIGGVVAPTKSKGHSDNGVRTGTRADSTTLPGGHKGDYSCGRDKVPNGSDRLLQDSLLELKFLMKSIIKDPSRSSRNTNPVTSVASSEGDGVSCGPSSLSSQHKDNSSCILEKSSFEPEHFLLSFTNKDPSRFSRNIDSVPSVASVRGSGDLTVYHSPSSLSGRHKDDSISGQVLFQQSDDIRSHVEKNTPEHDTIVEIRSEKVLLQPTDIARDYQDKPNVPKAAGPKTVKGFLTKPVIEYTDCRGQKQESASEKSSRKIGGIVAPTRWEEHLDNGVRANTQADGTSLPDRHKGDFSRGRDKVPNSGRFLDDSLLELKFLIKSISNGPSWSSRNTDPITSVAPSEGNAVPTVFARSVVVEGSR